MTRNMWYMLSLTVRTWSRPLRIFTLYFCAVFYFPKAKSWYTDEGDKMDETHANDASVYILATGTSHLSLNDEG